MEASLQDPRYPAGFACASLAMVWATLTTLLVLAWLPCPAGLVLMAGADRGGFVRQAASMSLVFGIATCWTGLAWWLLGA